jgi:hypothetical protein
MKGGTYTDVNKDSIMDFMISTIIHGRPPWGIQGIHGYPKLLNQYANLKTDLCAYHLISQNFSVIAKTVRKWWLFQVKVGK